MLSTWIAHSSKHMIGFVKPYDKDTLITESKKLLPPFFESEELSLHYKIFKE